MSRCKGELHDEDMLRTYSTREQDVIEYPREFGEQSDASELANSINTAHLRIDDLSALGIFPMPSEWTTDDTSTDVVQLALDAAGAFLNSPTRAVKTEDGDQTFAATQPCLFSIDNTTQSDGTVEEQVNS
ncbi:homeobox protein aristaless [Trichonephila inaurata madagascariensis]|uniref:Homeobox protein aristaless n=1 Tax=Trichonephila inaurata madagascariensis TaxID=2747483 RepID=A0A8X6XIZ8_9ARAC|nr:homeobox protein aristaless [Trichonephila inaurata madagascariensis]GFY74496.1 homeobox protein aristaless [Trichonephila inaurata madagascariensis]